MFTREDILRELELLPVWKLHTPLPTTPMVESAQTPQTETIVAGIELAETCVESAETDLPEAAIANETVANHHEIHAVFTATLICSDDQKWAFVLPADLTGQSADLFNNILRALQIKPTQTVHTQQPMQDIQHAQVVVAMGEIMAQQLLNSAEPLENLRGKQHLIESVQVVVTYHPDALLQHLPNKAKAWDDLCMALNILNG